jgi:hypothetical protein
MNSEKFISKFLKEFNPNEFQFVLISENITTAKRYKNVMPIQTLIPPPNVVTTFINEGMTKSYEKKYIEYLERPEINSLVTIIVKAALSGFNMILLCSKSEDDFKYLKMLCDFIEKHYKIKTYTMKKFIEDPNKAVKIKNKEEVTNIVMKAMEKLHEVDGEKIQPEFNKKKFFKKLEKLDKKELKQYCKLKGIKVDNDLGKNKLITKIMKKTFKD